MMSEINALWRRVRALQRRFARELAEYRLGLLCDDLCEVGSPPGPTTSPCPKSSPSSGG